MKYFPVNVKKILVRGIWKNNLAIQLCNNCSFGKLNNIPKIKDLSHWYESIGNTTNLGKNKRKDRPHSQFTFLRDSIDLNQVKSLLDYGVGNYPTLVELIHNYNQKIDINVSDISSFTCRVLKKYQFINNIYCVDEPKKIPGKFDLVALSHIINQVNDIFSFFKNISLLLNNNGFLFIELKNSNLDYYKYASNHSPYFFFFDFNSFNLLIKKYDLIMIKYATYGPTNEKLFKYNSEKHYLINDNGCFLRCLLKKIN